MIGLMIAADSRVGLQRLEARGSVLPEAADAPSILGLRTARYRCRPCWRKHEPKTRNWISDKIGRVAERLTSSVVPTRKGDWRNSADIGPAFQMSG
jgi:hypothetical protein